MADALTDRLVSSLIAPSRGNRITYDATVKGFGVRVTAAGAKAFVLNYRADGCERRITIGAHPNWNVKAARDHAKGLRRKIDVGEDPMADRHADRAAPTVNSLADRFEVEHLARRRSSTIADYESLLRAHIRPALGTKKVADLRHADVERMHALIAKKAPYRANRATAVLSKMLSLAVKWEMRTDNPARGVERAPEAKRERYLSAEEIERLAAALAAHKQTSSIDAIRLLLLTGARRGEMLQAQWGEFDLSKGNWTKPSGHTKSGRQQTVPLNTAAIELLRLMNKDTPAGCPYLFPSPFGSKRDTSGKRVYVPISEIKEVWAAICRAAGLAEAAPKLSAAGKPVMDRAGNPAFVWRSTVRIHDLRHTFASILVSQGLSLPTIGALLGHTQAQTTQRYAHLMDDPLRAATERVGVLVSGTTK